jgi:hypothetical protein
MGEIKFIPIYFGSSEFTHMNEQSVNEYLNKTQVQQDRWRGSYVILGSGFKYVIIPDYCEQVSYIKDSETPFEIAMANPEDGYLYYNGYCYYDIISIQNEQFRVFRTKNSLSSQVTIEIH